MTHPERWPTHIQGTRRYRFRRFPYLLVYHNTPERVVAVAVPHAKRRPGYWNAAAGVTVTRSRTNG